jgi:hypothetical protein
MRRHSSSSRHLPWAIAPQSWSRVPHREAKPDFARVPHARSFASPMQPRDGASQSSRASWSARMPRSSSAFARVTGSRPSPQPPRSPPWAGQAASVRRKLPFAPTTRRRPPAGLRAPASSAAALRESQRGSSGTDGDPGQASAPSRRGRSLRRASSRTDHAGRKLGRTDRAGSMPAENENSRCAGLAAMPTGCVARTSYRYERPGRGPSRVPSDPAILRARPTPSRATGAPDHRRRPCRSRTLQRQARTRDRPGSRADRCPGLGAHPPWRRGGGAPP